MVTTLAVLASVLMAVTARPPTEPPVARWVGSTGIRTGYAPGSVPLLLEVAALPVRSIPMASPWMDGAQDFTALAEARWVLETTHPDGAQRFSEMGEQGLLEHAVESGDQWQAYSPARMVLPTDPRAGQTFESSGTLRRNDGTAVAYRTRGEIAGDGDCLVIRLTDSVDGTDTTTQQTRCPDRGLVAFEDARGAWRAGDLRPPTLVGLTAGTGQGRLTGTPRLVAGMLHRGTLSIGVNAVSPVAHFTSGGHVIAGQSEGALIAFDDDLNIRWQRVPGGYITSVAAFGDLIVATTSWARVVTYDRNGTYVWEQTLPEAAVGEPAALDDGALVVRSRDGSVTSLDLRTGAQGWQTRAPDPASGIRVADGQVVLRGLKGVRALSAADGRELWSVDTGSDVVAMLATEAGWWVADSFSGLRLISPDGTVRYRGSLPGLPREIWPTAEGLIVVTDTVVLGLTPDGSERWRVATEPLVTSAPLQDKVLLLSGQHAFTIDDRGELTALPDELENNNQWKLSVDPQGRIWITGAVRLLGRWQ
ncbi:PQQ-binding-like beta-propeller repeat protein [Granulicoccus phenolivorans]|uniref:outer membrane protein assembly factor BamB family protein n=1 Tax=Granulicoccus phenolivorans TaxID=266854 RepID=UPI000412C543|nr:PQQ-binding-like beta-propeller repeat protein [Granulicoccus phenolivorans]